MPIHVQLPNGQIGEFPDGMADADIEKVLRSQFQSTGGSGMQAEPPPSQRELELAAESRKYRGMAEHPETDPHESKLQLFLAGVGKSARDTASGIAQLATSDGVAHTVGAPVYGVLDNFTGGGASHARQRAHDDITKSLDNSRVIDDQLTSTAPGFSGDIIGQVLQMATPLGVEAGGAKAAAATARLGPRVAKLAPYVKAATEGGLFAGAQGARSDESHLGNALLGAAFGSLGQGVASTVKGAAKVANNAIDPLVKKAVDLGIPLRLSEVFDSPTLSALTSMFSAIPGSGERSLKKSQQAGFNRAISSTFGEPTEHLSDDYMRSAKTNLQQQYSDALKDADISLSKQQLNSLTSILNDATRRTTETGIVNKNFDKIFDSFIQNNNSLSGEAYQSLRSKLNDVISHNSSPGQVIKDMRKVIDDAANNSLGDEAYAAKSAVDKKYAQFKEVEKVLQKAKNMQGDVDPTSLWSAIKEPYKQGDLKDVSRIGALIKEREKNMPNIMRFGVPTAIGGAGLAGGYLPILAGLAGAGLIGGRTLNSPTLGKLTAKATPEIGNALSQLTNLTQFSPYLGILGATAGKRKYDDNRASHERNDR